MSFKEKEGMEPQSMRNLRGIKKLRLNSSQLYQHNLASWASDQRKLIKKRKIYLFL